MSDVKITPGVAPKFQSPSIAFIPSRQSFRDRRRRKISLAILASLTLLAFWKYVPPWDGAVDDLRCRNLPGASDVVVVMKTGVTQLEDKLPIHLETTLKCYPNYVIFSDHEETYQGYEVRDVLANVDPEIRDHHDDFSLYRRVKAVGREGLSIADLTGTSSSRDITPDQKHTMGGWLLDKWKFLPMMNETFHLYPDHKWYVFVETDTYLFWSTVLKHLSTLDPAKPMYLGCQWFFEKYFFAHGGSGWVVSNAAMRLLVDHIASNSTELDKYVDSKWAGDYILGVVFDQIGVPLTKAWPIYQAHYLGIIDYGVTRNNMRFWCYPVGSYHHMTPDAVLDMWSFEQQWIKNDNKRNDPSTFIRHSDVFNNYMLPRMRLPRYDWDNQCSTIEAHVHTVDDCREACVVDLNCKQYMFDTNLEECKTSDGVRFGEGSVGSGIVSDWIFDRVEQWRNSLPPCHDESFVFSEIEYE